MQDSIENTMAEIFGSDVYSDKNGDIHFAYKNAHMTIEKNEKKISYECILKIARKFEKIVDDLNVLEK